MRAFSKLLEFHLKSKKDTLSFGGWRWLFRKEGRDPHNCISTVFPHVWEPPWKSRGCMDRCPQFLTVLLLGHFIRLIAEQAPQTLEASKLPIHHLVWMKCSPRNSIWTSLRRDFFTGVTGERHTMSLTKPRSLAHESWFPCTSELTIHLFLQSISSSNCWKMIGMLVTCGGSAGLASPPRQLKGLSPDGDWLHFIKWRKLTVKTPWSGNTVLCKLTAVSLLPSSADIQMWSLTVLPWYVGSISLPEHWFAHSWTSTNPCSRQVWNCGIASMSSWLKSPMIALYPWDCSTILWVRWARTSSVFCLVARVCGFFCLSICNTHFEPLVLKMNRYCLETGCLPKLVIIRSRKWASWAVGQDSYSCRLSPDGTWCVAQTRSKCAWDVLSLRVFEVHLLFKPMTSFFGEMVFNAVRTTLLIMTRFCSIPPKHWNSLVSYNSRESWWISTER